MRVRCCLVYHMQRVFVTLLTGSRLHGDRCTAGWEEHTNFADESAWLITLEWREVINLWTAWRHYVSRRIVRFMRGSLWFVSSRQQLSAPSAISFQLQLAVWYVMVRFTLEHRVFLYDTYVKYGFARKCRRKFRHKFRDERVPSVQKINNLVNKLRKTGHLIDKKQKHTRRVLIEKLMT
jgi:hypothetical protein